MDTQTIELLGRNRLMSELLRAGLEVAMPARDRGIDLIAYVDLSAKVSAFVACPIQMKAATKRAFSLNRKYEKISNLLIAYVWGLDDPEHSETYALSYPEAYEIADRIGWTKTSSWGKGEYSNSTPAKKILGLLTPYRMTPKAWWDRVVSSQAKEIALREAASRS